MLITFHEIEIILGVLIEVHVLCCGKYSVHLVYTYCPKENIGCGVQ